MVDNKKSYFQILRAICVIAVIFIHSTSLNGLDNASFHYALFFRQFINFPVAFFFFISGYFAATINYANLSKRLKRIFIPFIIWTSLYWIIHIIRGGEWGMNPIILSFFNGTGPGYHLYYLVVMIQFIILSPILINILSSQKRFLKILLFSITPIFLIFIYWLNYNQIDFLYRVLFINWLSFFVLGLYIRKNPNILSKYSAISLLIFVSIALLISVWEGLYLYYDWHSISFSTSQIKFSSYLFTVALILFLMKIQTNSNLKFLILIGDYSFGIYLIHLFVLAIPNKILTITNNSEFIAYPVLLIIKVSMTLVISLFVMMIMAKILPEKVVKYLGIK